VLLDRALDQSFNCRSISDVGADRFRLAARRGDGGDRRVGVASARDANNVRAAGGKPLGDRAANAA
jgi:hypothetical protein